MARIAVEFPLERILPFSIQYITLFGICFLAAAAAFTDRPWGAAQAQQAGDTPAPSQVLPTS